MKDSDFQSSPKFDRRLREGFALPAVLTVSGVVTLIFLVAITALASLTAEANSARARIRFLQKALTTEAHLSLLVTTEPIKSSAIAIGAPRILDLFSGTEGGASDLPPAMIRLDGHPYSLDLEGQVVIQIQDQAGMINLAALNDEQHARLMKRLGVKSEEIQPLRMKYLDYVDADDLRRLDGAEKKDYSENTPANRPLKRPTEWLSIMDARNSVDPKKWNIIRRNLAADHTLLNININTATKESLEILFGASEEQSKSSIDSREMRIFNSFIDFASAHGIVYTPDDERSYVFPSGRMVFTIQDTKSAWTYRGRLIMTPGGLEQPLWIDQTELTEAPRRAVADTSDATRLPYAPR